MTRERQLWTWTLANALGLGVGFVAVLQVGMLIRFGLDTELHWNPTPYGRGVRDYAQSLVGLLAGGAVLGSAQAFVVRSRAVRVVPWILSTAAGFGLLVAVIWPLTALEIWGRIPGPVEPIAFTVGGGSLAAVLQYLSLRRQGIVASRWLALWIGGLVASLVPTGLMFILIEGPLGLSVSWPLEVFLSGFVVAALAALISGRAFMAALSSSRPDRNVNPATART